MTTTARLINRFFCLTGYSTVDCWRFLLGQKYYKYGIIWVLYSTQSNEAKQASLRSPFLFFFFFFPPNRLPVSHESAV